jgi:hypothetical protein
MTRTEQDCVKEIPKMCNIRYIPTVMVDTSDSQLQQDYTIGLVKGIQLIAFGPEGLCVALCSAVFRSLKLIHWRLPLEPLLKFPSYTVVSAQV